ncbi:MAG: beta-propeller domain-containing protein [Oscillospiraceae bacterium]|nr:beta-propeller domain-containing protein [Oscillospiraceae bacterium]
MSEERLIKYINEAQVPDRLSPANISILLKQKKIPVYAHAAKRKRIRQTVSYVGALAACFLIVCSAAVNSSSLNKKGISTSSALSQIKKAGDYSELYTYMLSSGKKYEKSNNTYFTNKQSDMVLEETVTASDSTDDAAQPQSEDHDFSQTITQCEGVDESDMVKTDGENIFYVSGGYLYWTKAQDSLDSCRSYRIDSEDQNENINYEDYQSSSYYGSSDVCEMYLSGETISVVYNSFSSDKTYINIYQIDSNDLTLTQTYSQSGRYLDSRIVGETLYIISDDMSDYYDNVDSPDDTDMYVPEYTCMDDKKLIDPDDIYIPDKIQPSSCLCYAVVGAVNINDTTLNSSFTAFAGFDGEIYCTPENLYIANELDSGNSQIIKIALDSTILTPAATAEIQGTVLNQFSMDEYNGYFRVATTRSAYSKQYGSFVKNAIDECIGAIDNDYYHELNTDDNSLYVLDTDLNIVSSLKGYGKNEQIKSVNFQGDTAYVVTFRQTDPLFKIDLRDPSAPEITDEFKISGFSTFLHKWSDGLLLGFGSEATENGFVNGVKVTMFNTQADETTACDTYRVTDDELDIYLNSYACRDRKALLIDPDKNLIGFPVMREAYDSENSGVYYSYIFLRFNEDHFEQIGSINSSDFYTRAIFVDDNIYTFTDKGIQKTSINNFDETESYQF